MEWWKEAGETRIFIAPDSKGAKGDGEGCLLSLRHPKTGKPTCYLLNEENLQEIHWFKQPYTSWFLGDYVCEDGSLYAATQVDPIFLLLPLFVEARMKKGNDPGKFRQLDEILFVDGYPDYIHLSSICYTNINCVCDMKEVGSIKFFRLDDSKLLAWLYSKICRLVSTFPTLGANFAAQDDKNRLADAVAMLREYVNEEFILKDLCQRLGVRLDAQNEPKEAEDVEIPSNISKTTQGDDQASGKNNRPTRQVKKLKLETNSHNIKDMFSRTLKK